MRTRLFRPFLSCLLVLGVHANLFAQFPTLPGTVEISGYTGGSFDFPGAGSAVLICVTSSCERDLAFGRKIQPLLGAQVAVSLRSFLWVYGDVGLMFRDTQQTTVTLARFTDSNETTRRYWTATGGVELTAPTIHRVVPLFRLGFGGVNHDYSSITDRNFYGLYASQRLSKETIPALTIGGGIRLYASERGGARILVDGFLMGRGVDQLAAGTIDPDGYAYVSRKSGGRITIGFFVHLGR